MSFDKARYLSGPLQLVINITNKCNQKCLHCFNNSGESENELSKTDLYKLVEDIVDIKPYNVCFSGGEPLLRKEELIHCSKLLSNNGIRVSLVSNGMLIDKNTADELASSGVKEISISLDAHEEKIHNYLRGNECAFSKTFENLKMLNENKIINFEPTITINKINLKCFEDFIIFMIENGFKKIGVRTLVSVGRATSHGDMLKLGTDDLRYISKIVSKYKDTIKIIYYDSINHLIYYRNGEAFTGMEIKANGDIIPTPYLQISLGNIKKHSLLEYWNAGWYNIWKTDFFKKVTSVIYCTDDLEAMDVLARQYISEDSDLIDNNDFLFLNDVKNSSINKISMV